MMVLLAVFAPYMSTPSDNTIDPVLTFEDDNARKIHKLGIEELVHVAIDGLESSER